jgi:hypothetical protein
MIDWTRVLEATIVAAIGFVFAIFTRIFDKWLDKWLLKDSHNGETGQTTPDHYAENPQPSTQQEWARNISLILFVVFGLLFFVSVAVAIWSVHPPQSLALKILMVVTLICGIVAIIYEIILRIKINRSKERPLKLGGVAANLEAMQLSDLKRVRNRCLILFMAGVAIEIGFAFLPHPGANLEAHKSKIEISITTTPPPGEGDPVTTTPIAGKVSGVIPTEVQIVIYAHTNHWYVQPYTVSPITEIQPDGKWNNVTHPGRSYAVLLVKQGFVPQDVTDALPGVGGNVVSMTTVTFDQQ